ncbi:MAG TPA: MoxR family ATPase [Acidimicrobiales bacterium]|nr:MoxR family ATPase [Acidimicrobiales bacterium]
MGPVVDLATAVFANLSQVIRGKPEQLRLVLVALLSGGHLLVEDPPGMGKTLLAKGIACSMGASFSRIQGTPDLLPAELTGTNVFHAGTDQWEFRPGPLFSHVVLVDEMNRATPRTQSALLEAMEEAQVSVDGDTRPLPEPFFVVATQNPLDHLGTFPLVEGQRDRFAMVLNLGLPARDAERELLLGVGGVRSLDALAPVTTPESFAGALATVRQVHCEPKVADYVLDLVDATREHPDVIRGASPRASLSFLHAAQAHAAMDGRPFVVPDDVKAVAVAVLSHRLVFTSGPDIAAGASVVHAILGSVAPPR